MVLKASWISYQIRGLTRKWMDKFGREGFKLAKGFINIKKLEAKQDILVGKWQVSKLTAALDGEDPHIDRNMDQLRRCWLELVADINKDVSQMILDIEEETKGLLNSV